MLKESVFFSPGNERQNFHTHPAKRRFGGGEILTSDIQGDPLGRTGGGHGDPRGRGSGNEVKNGLSSD